MLSFGAKTRLRLQYGLDRIAAMILVPIYFAVLRSMGYRIRDLRAVRKACLTEFKKHNGPWLICANHLTMIDSALISYAMLSLPNHLYHYRWAPWNLPERSNFSHPLIVLLCYLSKCIPIHRGGSREEMKENLEKCAYLFKHRHSLLVFPEGGRSRTGRVDMEHFSYGVGRFLDDDSGDLKVMCLYLRGDNQSSYSFIPCYGERFTVMVDVLTPEKSTSTGLRAQRDYARQVIEHLAEMEVKYFDTCRKRHSGSDRSRQYRKEPRLPISSAGVYHS